jgi:FkbM family methyltransferase
MGGAQAASGGPWPASSLVQFAPGELRYIGFAQRDLIAQRLQACGTFEPEVVNAALRLLQQQPPGTVLDVGANIGSFSLPVAAANPGHRLICYEAQRLVAYQLCGAAALNGLSNIHVSHAAVAQQGGGTMQIAMPDYGLEANIGAMSADARINALRGACTRGVAEAVRVVCLDDLPVTDLRLLKIDVEGMELPVLRGAEALLARNGYPPIIFECWNADWFEADRLALFAWFARHGYQLQGLGDNFVATQMAR